MPAEGTIRTTASLVVPIDPERPPQDLPELRLVADRLGLPLRLLGLAPWRRDGRQAEARIEEAARVAGLDPDTLVDVIPTYEPGAAVAAWVATAPGAIPVLPRRGPVLGHVPVSVVAASLGRWLDVPVVRSGPASSDSVVAVVEPGPGDVGALALAGTWAAGLGGSLEVVVLGEELDLPWLSGALSVLPRDLRAEVRPVRPCEAHPGQAAGAGWVVAGSSPAARALAFPPR